MKKYLIIFFFIFSVNTLFAQYDEYKLNLPTSHSGNVYWCEFDSTGEKMLSNGKDGEIILRETKSGVVISNFHHLSSRVNLANFSPNGEEIIITEGDHNLIHLYNTKTLQLLKSINLNFIDVGVEDVVKSPNANNLLINLGNAFIVYDLNRDSIITKQTFDESTYLNVLKFDSHGNYILVGTNKKESIVYNSTGLIKLGQKKLSEEITDIFFDEKTKRVLTKDFIGNILIWDITSGKMIKSLLSYPEYNRLVFDQISGLFAFNTSQTQLQIWDIRSCALHIQLKSEKENNMINEMSFVSKDKILVSYSSGINSINTPEDIVLYELANGKIIGEQKIINVFAIYPNPKMNYALVQNQNAISLLELDSMAFIYSIPNNYLTIEDIYFKENNSMFLSTSNGTCVEFDLKEGKLIYSYYKNQNRLIASKYSSELNELYCVNDNNIFVWDTNNKKFKRKLLNGLNSMNSFELSKEGKKFVAATDYKTILIGSLETGEISEELKIHNHIVSFACFNKSGNSVLSCSADAKAIIYNLTTKQSVLELNHDSWINKALFSISEDTIITIDHNKVFLWNTETGQLIDTLSTHSDYGISDICLNYNGRYLAAADMCNVYFIDLKQNILVGVLNTLRPLQSMSFYSKEYFISTSENSFTIWNIQQMKKITTSFLYLDNDAQIIHLSDDGRFSGNPDFLMNLKYPNNNCVRNDFFKSIFYDQELWKKSIR
jgi:WD40 repeat protein